MVVPASDPRKHKKTQKRQDMLILHGFIPSLKLRRNDLYKLRVLCCDETEAEKGELVNKNVFFNL